MSKVKGTPHLLSELDEINQELIPLKALADREFISIIGLTGKVYTPHLDVYMQLSIKRAQILACLKRQKILPISAVEIITAELDEQHKRTQNHGIVVYKNEQYQRKFTPLKLSKSGKNVQKWAKFWLLLQPDGTAEPEWERQVREIWPSYFLIRSIEL